MVLRTILFCAFITLPLSSITHAATNDLTTLLQRGLFEEEANRNLDAAISNYQSLANDFDKDRQLAATAIFRLGECYRKLGRTNEAVAQYQRIIREFSDQQTLATLSQQNLAGLGATPQRTTQAASETQAASGSLQELQTLLTTEKANYDQKQTLLDTLKKMNRKDIRKALPTMVPDDRLNTLLSELDLAQQNLLQMKADYSPDHPKYVVAKESVDDLDLKIEDRMKGILTGLQAQLDASKAHQDWIQKRIELVEHFVPAQSATEQQSPITDEEEKEIRRIQQMIQNSPDLINAPSGDPSLTPLARAAELGQLRVARFLIEAKADVNQKSGYMTPLQHAASKGQRAMVELLLASGANVNVKGLRERRALHSAAGQGFVSVTETLLAAKADVNATDSDGNSPLTLAVQNGFRPEAELLLAHGADPNVITATSPYSPPPENSVGAPLHFAVLRKDQQMVALLLTNYAQVDLRSPLHKTALDIAAENDSTEIVRELLDADANPNPKDQTEGEWTPLFYAMSRKNLEIVKMLLSKGANVNSTASAWGTTDITPLMYAVVNNDEAATSVLLEKGADPNLKEKSGSTALWYALGERAKLVFILLEHGADPNEAFNGTTPLMEVAVTGAFASPEDRLAAAKLLIEKGANVNAKDSDGQTALHKAVLHNRPEMVELLLANKADVNVPDKSGKTPLEYAKEQQGSRQPGTPAFLPPPPMRLPPGMGLPGSSGSPTGASAPPEDIVKLLRQHGALDELPDFNTIRVTREGLPVPTVVFERQSNDWNHYTLLETILRIYSLGQIRIAGNSWTIPDNALGFPNLARIIIHRPDHTQIGKTKEITVSLFNNTNGIDCSRDVPLSFGDIVEIPLRDYNLNEPQVGLTDSQKGAITTCLSRKVRLVVHGESRELTPWSSRAYLKAVLGMADAKSLLLSSSDLARVKVTRKDPATGKTVDFVVDASNSIQSSQDLWLRDGDVIEVPEKPE